jgi:hypothetical protein
MVTSLAVGSHDVAYMIGAKSNTPLSVRRAAHAQSYGPETHGWEQCDQPGATRVSRRLATILGEAWQSTPVLHELGLVWVC